jgi:hypothetical protein
MPQTPPEEDDAAPDDPESRFLIALWDNLERAQETAVERDVMKRLGEVLEHCEAAAAVIRGWLAQSP